MRSRQDYEQSFKTTLVTSGQESVTRMQMDILLDIRELLIEMKEARQLKEVIDERIRAEQDRLSIVKIAFDNK